MRLSKKTGQQSVDEIGNVDPGMGLYVVRYCDFGSKIR